MKALNLSLVAVALSLSAQAMAHNKVDFTEPQAESKEMSRGEFLGTDIQYYVKTETGIKQAKQLVKGQKS